MASKTKADRYDELATLFGLTDPLAGLVGAPTKKWNTHEIVSSILRLLGHIVPCGRCGGSGSYSFNYMDGTRCYGCGGKGTKIAPLTATLHKRIVAEHAEGKVAAIQATNRNLRALRYWSNEDQRSYYADDAEWVAAQLAIPTVEIAAGNLVARVRGGAASIVGANFSSGYHGTDHDRAVAWANEQLAKLAAA